ncbi:hypothetical protein H5410_002857 [Solanum commersonii]|uniref:Uncharacterized protein n=1 Tax=Solanum commersonii TaxID=4109 RepID=A0A9J6B3C3_SOLCO|nr:hypothetical protein H5410_002857 [Solanum commersonii]
MKRSSRHVTEQFCEVVLLSPNASKYQNVEGKRRKAMKSTKRWIVERIDDPDELHRMCFWLAQERGRKTKTTKLIAGAIGSTWVQLERVKPSPSPTHLARESKWAKAKAVLNAETQCSRETELI